MQLTRMAWRPWSPAIERVRPTMAAFEVLYGVLWFARKPATDETLMIEPPPALVISGIAYLEARTLLLPLGAITRALRSADGSEPLALPCSHPARRAALGA